jgi:Hsp70 protein
LVSHLANPKHLAEILTSLGTTFSGVAWAQTARVSLTSSCSWSGKGANTSKPETQTTIVQWPDGGDALEGATNDKVPTELCYNGSECKWGFEIPEGRQRYQWFKLELDPKKTKETSYLSRAYPDPNALPLSFAKSAEVLSVDYLTKLREHVVRILKTKLGDGVVESTTIEYVITVPAIWSEAAKYRTRGCAKRAGMGGDLQIISEPEAAVIYALDATDPENLQVGDTFVLCDAGGGTVDLISYTIEELKPTLRIREAAPGNGAACGSTFLNRMFRKYLEDNFGNMDSWDEDTLDGALERFETVAKRKFNGEQNDIAIPVPGLANDRNKGILRGKLTLPSSTLRKIFKPVIASIVGLVMAQIKLTGGDVKSVLLVGGFGQSPYLRESIREVIGSNIQVIQPPKGWTAVVRGALIKGLAEASPTASRITIGSRVARKAYGFRLGMLFEEGKHEKGRRLVEFLHPITELMIVLDTGTSRKAFTVLKPLTGW